MNPFYTSCISNSDYEDFQSFWLGTQFYEKVLCAEICAFISKYEYILTWQIPIVSANITETQILVGFFLLLLLLLLRE